MQRILNFFRLRKQNDTVKIICILILVGVFCLVQAVYHAGLIYQFVNTPVEYVLAGVITINDAKLREFEQTENVAAVSREMEISVSIKYKGTTVNESCVLLSRNYLERAYHVNVTGSEKVIYMNETAADNLRQTFIAQGIYISFQPTADNTEYDIRYAEEGTESSKNYKSAKLVIIKDSLHDTLPFICMAEDGIRLSKESTALRILLKQHNLDRIQVNNFQYAGYEIENENDIIKEEYELKIRMLHIGYGVLIWGICTLSAAVLWHQVQNVKNQLYVGF